jgi:soluble lytic murein transglycosylase
MWKRREMWVGLGVGAGVCALGLGVGVTRVDMHGAIRKLGQPMPPIAGSTDAGKLREITAQPSLPPAQKVAKLEAIAKDGASINGSRARFLLAQNLMQQGQAKQAAETLKGLEGQYPQLAAKVLVKQGQAYEQAGDGGKAKAAWRAATQNYPQDSATAEALVELSGQDPTAGDRAIAQFPAHPRVLELVQQRLKQNPKQPQLLLVLARYGLHLKNYGDILETLTTQYAAQLKPEDWEAIAFGYWEKQDYGKAGLAYARAPQTARNLYRTARGQQLGGKQGNVPLYERVIATYPTSDEAGLALVRLARITKPEVAMAYADQAIARFPARAAEATLEKAKLLDKTNPTLAMQVRRGLIDKYPKTEEAAEVAWEQARERIKTNDVKNALVWSKLIADQNPESELAPQALFWQAKWTAQLNRQQEAAGLLQSVISRYPDSYYAWRSAGLLGWNVGDFDTVRSLTPSVIRPNWRPALPTGSAALQELYQLGQDQAAWELWQTEFKNRMQPTVAEQFTDGMIRIGVGDYLDGMFMVSFLAEREKAEEQAQFRDLKKKAAYWYTLYPFPFLDPIQNWSQQRQLNSLLVTALIRQESRFMPKIRSSAGAVGLMQVMPDTAQYIASNIKLKTYKLDNPEDSIKLGTWYLDYTHTEFRGNSMLAVASYNAGPGAVAGWLDKGVQDADAFVEAIPYDETRGYVKSVFGNYWNYMRLYNPEISQKVAQISKVHAAEVSPLN